MKKLFFRSLCCFSLTFTFFIAHSQQGLISVDGWNAYVHLPDDYDQNPGKNYPAIIFFPGAGEVGSSAGRVIQNGPGAYIAQGWNGNALGVKFIVISLQVRDPWIGGANIVNQKINILKSRYRIGDLTLTGLSLGGLYSIWYAQEYPENVNRIVTVEAMQRINTEDDESLKTFTMRGGKSLVFEQTNDRRKGSNITVTMNNWVANSSHYELTNFGGGGHCCWNEFYGGQGKQPGVFNINGINQNLYEWIARNITGGGQPANKPPKVTMGGDIALTLPKNSTKLTASASDEDGRIVSYKWRKKSGPSSYDLDDDNELIAEVEDLVEGVYEFELTVKDDKGATASGVIKVTVNPPAANKPPKVVMGNDIAITLPTNSTRLTATATDEDGNIVSYKWTKKSGPSSYDLDDDDELNTDVEDLVEGVYEFELTVKDNRGATASGVIKVTVKSAFNKAPTVSVGKDIVITQPSNSAWLTGSGADEDGSIVSYKWRKKSGPASYSFQDENAANTNARDLVPGVFEFELTVTDNRGATASAVIKVTVNEAPNKVPTASVGKDITITLPQNSSQLTGSASDEDGSIVSYKWTKKSGPASYAIANAAAANTAVNALTQGVYEFQLTVTDDKGATASATMKITVNAAVNKPPTVTVGKDIVIRQPSNSAWLTGSGADEDGRIVSYKWTKKSGPASYSFQDQNAANTNARDLVVGVYQFELTVTDDKGATASGVIQVTVNQAANKAPVVSAGKDVTITLPQNSTQLTGSASDEDGRIVSYKWVKKSGPSSYSIGNSNAAITSVNGLTQGVYEFQLTVTDDRGATASAITKVSVNAAANKPPTITVGWDILLYQPSNSAWLTGSASDEDGEIVSYKWRQKSGPAPNSFQNENAPNTNARNLIVGVYEFELTATDDRGATASGVIKVTVRPAKNLPPVANAGPNKSITLPGDKARLVGSGFSETGAIVRYAWRQIEGPSYATILEPEQAETDLEKLEAGNYRFVLTVTDNFGSAASDTMRLSVSVPRSVSLSTNVRIYPNPTPDEVVVEVAGEDQNEKLILSVSEMTGTVLMQKQMTAGDRKLYRERVDMRNLRKGIYILNVRSADGTVMSSKRIIKTE